MGFLSDLKKIFFGAKSVSKGVSKKTIDYTKEQSEHLLDVTEDFVSEKKDIINNKFDNIKSNASKTGSDIIENIKEKTTDIIENISESETYKKTVEVVEKAGDTVLDTGEKFIEKSKEFIDGPGRIAAEKFKETSEDIGSSLLEGGKTILNKASEIKKDLGDKLDETIKKSEEFAKKEKTNKDDLDFADTPLDIKESEFSDKDEFFKRADNFASGDYAESPKVRVIETKNTNKKNNMDIDGFEDLDKDGNPLIDDADIIE